MWVRLIVNTMSVQETYKYSYVYIIYRHTSRRTEGLGSTSRKYPIKYAMRVYGGSSLRVDRFIQYMYKNLVPICYYRYNSNKIHIANNLFTKYPRHKCRDLRSKRAPLCNKGFITYIKAPLQLIQHIITVEIDYHFGQKLFVDNTYAEYSKRYMNDPYAYFGPLLGVSPTAISGVSMHRYA